MDLIIPGLITDLVGAALFAVILMSQRTRMRRSAQASAAPGYRLSKLP